MSEAKRPVALEALDIAPRQLNSIYPEPFASRMVGREKRALGDFFGLVNFGVNLTRLAPGAVSALRHAHTRQDELIYILQGTPTLYSNEGRTLLEAGMCAGFRAGSGNAAYLANESTAEVLCLEIGDRTLGDAVFYPDDDLVAVMGDEGWLFTHKDGRPY